MAQKTSRHNRNQSNAKLTPITTWSPAFSRALRNLLGFSSSSYWFLKLFSSPLIGRCDNFGHGFIRCTAFSIFEGVILMRYLAFCVSYLYEERFSKIYIFFPYQEGGDSNQREI